MDSHRISDRIAAYVEDYLSVTEDKISFEMSLIPSPEGTPLLVVFFWMPGPVLGKSSVGSIGLSNPAEVTKESLGDSLREFFAQMTQARARAILEPAPAPPRGSLSASGLLLP